jgi:hypothetical protein
MRTWPLLLLVGCGSASARLELSNQSSSLHTNGSGVLADGTSLELRMIATYLAEDVDPVTMNNVGATSMIWLAPECQGDISGCNIAGYDSPAGGPRVTKYFDLARPSEEVNAELDAQDHPIEATTYRYARIEFCKSYDGMPPSEPTLLWAGPHMTKEEPFTSGDCGRTSLPFDPPLVVAPGDVVTVRLGYALEHAIVSGQPDPSSEHCSFTVAGHDDPSGAPHCFRTCVDTDNGHDCMDFPDFAPTAVRL